MHLCVIWRRWEVVAASQCVPLMDFVRSTSKMNDSVWTFWNFLPRPKLEFTQFEETHTWLESPLAQAIIEAPNL